MIENGPQVSSVLSDQGSAVLNLFFALASACHQATSFQLRARPHTCSTAAEGTKFAMNRECFETSDGDSSDGHAFLRFAVGDPASTTSSAVTQRVYIHPTLNTKNEVQCLFLSPPSTPHVLPQLHHHEFRRQREQPTHRWRGWCNYHSRDNSRLLRSRP